MVSLDGLPREILLTVADFIDDPHAVFDFAMTCRFLQKALMSQLVRHKNLARQYSMRRFELSCSEQYFVDLEQLLNNANEHRYIRTFEYHDQSYDFDEPEVPDEIIAQYLDRLEQTPLLNAAVASSWRSSEGRHVKDLATNGDIDAILAIILSNLRHVRILRLSLIRFYDCVQTLFKLVGEAYNQTTSLSFLPLQYLREVEMSVPDKNYSTLDPDWAFYLLRLPSLRKFRSHYMADEWRGARSQIDDSVALQHSKSLIESIVFEESSMHPRTTDVLLRDIYALRTFHYGCDCDGPYPMKYTPHNLLPQFVLFLLKYHSASLEILIFEDDDSWQENYDDYYEDQRPIECPSMQSFLTLKVLHCCIALLKPVPGDELHSEADCVLDRLPTSLQRLYIYDTTRKDNNESVLQFLRDLEQKPGTALPSLRILWLGPRFSESTIERVRETCQRRGLEFLPPEFGRYRE